jgi:cell division protein FtsQ
MKDVKKESVGRERAIKKNTAKHKRRRKRNLSLYYFLMGLLTVSVLIVLSLTVFFKISDVEVLGESAYQNSDIFSTAAVPIGSNLLMLDTNQVKTRILDKYLLIDNISIKKKLPSSVEITVFPAVNFFQLLSTDGRYLTVSLNNKVLSLSEERDEALMLIKGVAPSSLREGDVLGSAIDGKEVLIKNIKDAFEKGSITDIREINFISPADIRVNIENRLEVKLGSESKIDYKIQLVSAVINEKIGKNESGTIDATVEGTAGFIAR